MKKDIIGKKTFKSAIKQVEKAFNTEFSKEQMNFIYQKVSVYSADIFLGSIDLIIENEVRLPQNLIAAINKYWNKAREKAEINRNQKELKQQLQTMSFLS